MFITLRRNKWLAHVEITLELSLRNFYFSVLSAKRNYRSITFRFQAPMYVATSQYVHTTINIHTFHYWLYFESVCKVLYNKQNKKNATVLTASRATKRQQHKHIPYYYIRRERLVCLLTLHVWRNLELTGTDKWVCKITNTNNHYNKGKIKNK